MTWILIRHHALMRVTYLKWLVLILATSTLWLGIMGYRLGGELLTIPWLQIAWIWIAPALYVVFGPHTERAREFALTLPLTTRTIWNAHVAALLLTSGLMVGLTLAVVQLSLHGLYALLGPLLRPADSPAGPLLNFWMHGLAWWLLLAAMVLGDQPGVARIPRDRRWLGRQLIKLALAFAGLLGLGLLGPAAAVVPVVGAGILLARAYRNLPPAWSFAPREPQPRQRPGRVGALTSTIPWWRRRPTWLVIVQTTSKHPVLLLVAAAALLFLGFVQSSWTATTDGGEHLGVFMIPMVSYCLMALAGAPLLKLGVFDHLPLSRDQLLSYLIAPQLVLLLAGLVGGEILAPSSEVKGDWLTWSNEADTYGLRMMPRFFVVAWGEPPENVGPDGAVSTPPSDWRPLGTRGPVLYKPFHTPPGSSLEFCAWQLERASEHIYGQTVAAAEFRDRYLTENPDGVVSWRANAPTLREDHPELTPRRLPGLLPLQVLLGLALFQIAFRLHLGTFRPRVRDKVRVVSFVGLLAALMVIYLAPFLLSMAGLGDPSGLNILVLAVSDQLVAVTPGGVAGMWLVVITVLAAGHWLVLHGFRRAEWPPVREDDTMFDVLG